MVQDSSYQESPESRSWEGWQSGEYSQITRIPQLGRVAERRVHSSHQNPAVGKGGRAAPTVNFHTRLQRRPRSSLKWITQHDSYLKSIFGPGRSSGGVAGFRVWAVECMSALPPFPTVGFWWVDHIRSSATLPNCGILVSWSHQKQCHPSQLWDSGELITSEAVPPFLTAGFWW